MTTSGITTPIAILAPDDRPAAGEGVDVGEDVLEVVVREEVV
jgi:hypothetical protein